MKLPVVVLVSLLVMASPLLADEHPIAAPASIVSTGTQSVTAIATDGTDFLVCWLDQRDVSFSIHAARVDTSGVRQTDLVLQSRDRTLTQDQFGAVAAWTGRLYLVAWYDVVKQKPVMARIDRQGALLDVRTLPGSGRPESIASSATRTMLIITDAVLLFDPNGDGIGNPVDYSGLNEPFAVVSNGRSFFAASFIRNGAFFQEGCGPISDDGVLGTQQPLGNFYGLATDGSDYMVVERTTPNYRYTHLDQSGNVRSLALLPRTGVLAGYHGGYLLLSFDEANAFHATPLDHDAKPSGDIPVPLTAGGYATFQSNALGTLFVHALNGHLYSSILGASSETPLQPGPPRQALPAVAAGAGGWLAAWSEQRSPNVWEIRAARLSADGLALDGEGMLLGSQTAQTQARVGFNGQHYLVSWIDRSNVGCNIRMARVSTDGHVVDSKIILNDCANDLAFASAPDRALLTWSSNQGSSVLKAVIIDRNGDLGTFGFPPDSHAQRLAAAWSDNTWLIVWNVSNDAFAARLAPDGTSLDKRRIPIANDFFYAESVSSVAGNGSGFLVAFSITDGSHPGTVPNVLLRHVSNTGVLSDPIVFPGSRPSVTWNGSDFLVAWENENALYMKTLAENGTGRPLAPSVDRQSSVLVTRSGNAMGAVYVREAMQWPYLDTPTIYFLRFTSHPRTAVHP